MPAKIAHHAHPVAFGKVLDGRADITKSIARLYRLNAQHQRFMRDLNQPLIAPRELARHIHARGIPKPAVQNAGDVNIQNITVFQHLCPRNPVANHVVDRDTAGMLITPIADGGRGRARVLNERLNTGVQLTGGHAGLHILGDHIKASGSQLARGMHPGKIFRGVNTDAVFI